MFVVELIGPSSIARWKWRGVFLSSSSLDSFFRVPQRAAGMLESFGSSSGLEFIAAPKSMQYLFVHVCGWQETKDPFPTVLRSLRNAGQTVSL